MGSTSVGASLCHQTTVRSAQLRSQFQPEPLRLPPRTIIWDLHRSGWGAESIILYILCGLVSQVSKELESNKCPKSWRLCLESNPASGHWQEDTKISYILCDIYEFHFYSVKCNLWQPTSEKASTSRCVLFPSEIYLPASTSQTSYWLHLCQTASCHLKPPCARSHSQGFFCLCPEGNEGKGGDDGFLMIWFLQ